jgi:hypothetical protein
MERNSLFNIKKYQMAFELKTDMFCSICDIYSALFLDVKKL